MNNTIYGARLNQSKPSFGSFSPKASELINKENVDRLVAKGISLADLTYLKNHPLNIHVAKPLGAFYSGDALFLLNRDSMLNQAYATCSGWGSKDIKLTPSKFTIDSVGNFVSESRDIEKTLPTALKKALKIIRKFDAIQNEMNEYFAKFGSEISKLKSSLGHKEIVYKNQADAFLSNIESTEVDNSVELLKGIKRDKRKLKHYRDAEYFEKKQEKLFS